MFVPFIVATKIFLMAFKSLSIFPTFCENFAFLNTLDHAAATYNSDVDEVEDEGVKLD